MTSHPLIESLRAAVEGSPDAVELRAHLARLLLDSGHIDEAVVQAATALQRDPSCGEALAVIASTASALAPHPRNASKTPAESPVGSPASGPDDEPYELETSPLRLSDVGGMTDVKARLEAAFLAPLRNPELRRLYRTSLHGGLLLYGPPGCGKTMIARALAGELGAAFLSVSLADVLDMYVGQSERNVQALFAQARRHAPCVVFLDELDALGQKRSQRHFSGGRGSVNQLLTEMDGVAGHDDQVYVLAATNHPWDVDVALRRPGRLDRMMLVAPPDLPARAAILESNLRERPLGQVDVAKLAKATEGFSGADLAHVCQNAAERALLDSASLGRARPIQMTDLTAALADVRPSTGPWFEVARNVAQFANGGGAYDDLLAYLRRRRLL